MVEPKVVLKVEPMVTLLLPMVLPMVIPMVIPMDEPMDELKLKVAPKVEPLVHCRNIYQENYGNRMNVMNQNLTNPVQLGKLMQHMQKNQQSI